MPYPIICFAIGLTFLAATVIAYLLAGRGFPLPAGEKRIGCIDGLRGYLALSVMTHHFIVWLNFARGDGKWSPSPINFFQQLGAGGVALFFMTTGLLFYPRILKGFRGNSWPAIYVSRFFRIIPLSIFSFALITLVIHFHTGNGLDADFPSAAMQWITAAGEPPLLGYADAARVNVYVLWSLKYEWQFYLVALPLCAFTLDRLFRRLPSWTLPVAVIAVGLIGKNIFPDVGLFKYLPLFATGMLAFEAQSRPAIALRLQSRVAASIALGALAAAMVLFRSPYDLAWPLFALFFAAVACGNNFWGMLNSRASLVLGECSYGIYLMHGVVLFVLFTHGTVLTDLFSTPALPLLMPVAGVAIVLLTAAAYVAVERPGMSAGRVLANRWRSWSAKKAAYAVE
jgi:peptidoglycan/LPS O-acetylase OafA/YrhL